MVGRPIYTEDGKQLFTESGLPIWTDGPVSSVQSPGVRPSNAYPHIQVAGGNLLALAASQFNDATQWYRFAQLRVSQPQATPLSIDQQLALWDPWLSGPVTLAIPAPLPFGGGTDGVLGL